MLGNIIFIPLKFAKLSREVQKFCLMQLLPISNWLWFFFKMDCKDPKYKLSQGPNDPIDSAIGMGLKVFKAFLMILKNSSFHWLCKYATLNLTTNNACMQMEVWSFVVYV